MLNAFVTISRGFPLWIAATTVLALSAVSFPALAANNVSTVALIAFVAPNGAG